MSYKVIFLDCDGVLNNKPWLDEQPLEISRPFDPKNIAFLNSLTHQTQARIVVSSNWRHDMKYLTRKLREAGVTGNIFDRTSDLEGQPRGMEILVWLRKHPGVSRYVVLDDEDDIEPHVQNHVKTSFDYGLTLIEYSKALGILNGNI